MILSKQERRQEAEQSLQEALALCRDMAAPYAEAKTRYTAGVVSRMRGELGPARQWFEAALTILERLGERLYSRSIEQLLSKSEGGQQ
ncbi:MAG TPA: tetratricopeptide repeat protein, partial [Ktedonobacteraceae bacterium]|nr:tetratricopeptide repeat protein [Ktedonobacteraceae bacterium]